MSTSVYFISLTAMFGTVIVVFAMKYGSAVFAARARLAGDAAYRSLAEQALAAQAEQQAALAGLRADLSQLATSVAAVEKILKQVE
ncbi:MAG: hypothetical protein JSR73_16215 [Proteobacteria bacterium]|nr:hypothetical protein [Pseudomonadota bacterium]